MIWRLKVKRGWDEACDKAMFALAADGILGGIQVRLTSVEISMSHVLRLEFTEYCGDADRVIKYWLRALVKAHR